MSYVITPCFFSIKCPNIGVSNENKAHRISYEKCNFRCGFCDFSNRNNPSCEIIDTDYESKFRSLYQQSRYFKFTGGEPTLNPNLKSALRLVKNIGGIVLLDTNGSEPDIINDLISDSLIDVIGISLKGYDAHTATSNAGISNTGLAWHNVLKTISIGNASKCSTIVTIVLYDYISALEINKYAAVLSSFQNVYLKINNYMPCKHQGTMDYRPCDYNMFMDSVCDFLKISPNWKKRVIGLPTSSGMTEQDSVIFL